MTPDQAVINDLQQRFQTAMVEMNKLNFEPFVDLWHEDAVWHSGGQNAYAGRHVGRAAIEEYFRAMYRMGMSAQPLEILADDEHFVFFIRITGERDGKVLDQIHADAWRVRDGRFTEGFFLVDDQEAFDRYVS